MSNKTKALNIFNDILTDEERDRIEKMVQKFKKNEEIEFEVSFRNIDYPNYMRISEHYVDMVDEKDISSVDSLDISILLEDGNTYRVSIVGEEQIDLFLQKFGQAKVPEIQKYLLGLDPSESVEIVYKDRGSADRLYLEDLATVFKVTTETPVTSKTKKPVLTGTEKMLYRNKRRFSFALNENVRIDITDVQESRYPGNLTSRPSNYELEIEILNDKITLDTLLTEVTSVLRIVQDTEIPIGKKESQDVLQQYQKLLGIKPSSHLDARNVISMEAQHIVKFVPNKYAITDKADGDRYFLFSTEDGVYLLSTNLVVKKVNIIMKDSSCTNLLLDGELVINENGRMYLAFDVVYANNVDYRYGDKYILTQRLIVLNQIIDKCFGNLVPFMDYTDKHNDLEIEKIKIFYTKELKTYWTRFKKELENTTSLFVTRKLYFVPYGIDPSEVFLYADLVWKLSVYGKLPPYTLDGIIYTPISMPYLIGATLENIDTVPMEYKWKPPSQNSIDFYIRFEKDARGNDAIYYDNAVVKVDSNAYKICRLYVGLVRGGQEKPIPFKVNGLDQKANIYLVDGEATDSQGSVITDQTVVEFIFDTAKPDIDDAFRWIPVRTRYDKTESVQKYRKRYGNNLNIAVRIWRSIINPVTEENIASLGNTASYQKEFDRLSKSMEAYTKQGTVYYQKKTANAAGMRAFNNWVKSNIILAYCRNKERVLDIGCGRGGDLLKFILAGVKEYVGIDIDHNGLYVIGDSAFNRYKNFKKQNPNVPPMYFIQADARALFTPDSQQSALPNMTAYNKKLIETHLSGNKTYNVISCQFSIHYYLSDPLSWSNFCKNISKHLDVNGYFLVTCFDGQLIYDKMLGKPKMTVSYTDNNGNKSVFFEIVKIYSDSEKTNIGMAIDLYNSLISNPGTYNREFLVFPDFLEESLKKNCGLELVETDSFFNLFNLYKNYFMQEGLDELGKRQEEIKKFYLTLDPAYTNIVEADAARASFKLSMLNRYYVFKKTAQIDVSEPSRIVGVNHKINLGKVLEPYFITNRMAIDPASKTRQINKIYHDIRSRYATKPTVYLIRHTIPEENFENETYRRNKLEFTKLREGGLKTLLIYKSPEKYFYPIYYLVPQGNYDETTPLNQERIYLLDSDKVVNDINILVGLSEKLEQTNK